VFDLVALVFTVVFVLAVLALDRVIPAGK